LPLFASSTLLYAYDCSAGGLASLSWSKYVTSENGQDAHAALSDSRGDIVRAAGAECLAERLDHALALEPLVEADLVRQLPSNQSIESTGITSGSGDSRPALSSAEVLSKLLSSQSQPNQLVGQPLSPDRGYHAKSCSFDLDDDLVYGEIQDDCNVCDGVTTDPDGDGVQEDLIYVDASNGGNNSSCGSPGSPCRTITYALSSRADGPGDGAEDIICIRGRFRNEPIDGITFPHGGVAGTKTRNKAGSEARNFKYPKNPLMIVGWDFDNDGSYPPQDNDDIAIIDGDLGEGIAFHNPSAYAYIEIAHLSVENFGNSNLGLGVASGLWRSSTSSDTEYVFLHDLEMDRMSQGRCHKEGKILSHSDYKYFAFENVKCNDCGSYFFRGGVDTDSVHGPIRVKNMTLICHACDGGRCRISDSWGGTRGWEWLDSFFDLNSAGWDHDRGAAYGITQTQCLQDLDIVNNEFKDFSPAISVEFGDPVYCNPGVPTTDLTVDRNVHYRVSNVSGFGSPSFIELAREGGEGSNRLSGEMLITNNLVYSANGQGFSNFIWTKGGIGNNETPQDAQITVANNTLYINTWGNFNEAFATIENPNTTYKQQHFSFINNIVVGPAESDSNNMIVEYAPNQWTSEFNSFAPGNGYIWNNVQRNNIVNWRAASGSDTNSNECVPAFQNPSAGDFHLKQGDACAKDKGTPLATLFQHDMDFDVRGQGAGWDRGADEYSVATPGLYSLSVSRNGSGSGTVTSSPAGINCGSDCVEQYAEGTTVALTAIPSAGSVFANWSGHSDCSDGQVTMNANKSCTATFTVNSPPSVSITAPLTNVALNASVTSSGSEFAGREPEFVVDGIVEQQGEWWAASGAPNWVEIDLGAEHVIDRISAAPFAGSPSHPYFYDNSWLIRYRDPSGLHKDFSNVQKTSGSGTLASTGISITSGDPGSSNGVPDYKFYEFTFDPVPARFLKFKVTDGDSDGDSNLTEIEVEEVFPNGSPVTFRGTSVDSQEGNISEQINWSSDLDGFIGSGSVVTFTFLSVGPHTISATVTDSAGLMAASETQIRVTGEDPRDPEFSDGFESGSSGSWSSVVP